MPPKCVFTLNSNPTSTLICDGVSYEAFSGLEDVVNNPKFTDSEGKGPLPMGTYYIVDRESGGRLGWLWEFLEDLYSETERNKWFALYRDDETIDDFTSINNIKRGNFRLHPIGNGRISKGCITLTSHIGYEVLQKHLRNSNKQYIPGTNIAHYGTIEVQ